MGKYSLQGVQGLWLQSRVHKINHLYGTRDILHLDWLRSLDATITLDILLLLSFTLHLFNDI